MNTSDEQSQSLSSSKSGANEATAQANDPLPLSKAPAENKQATPTASHADGTPVNQQDTDATQNQNKLQDDVPSVFAGKHKALYDKLWRDICVMPLEEFKTKYNVTVDCDAVRIHKGTSNWASLLAGKGVYGMYETKQEALQRAICAAAVMGLSGETVKPPDDCNRLPDGINDADEMGSTGDTANKKRKRDLENDNETKGGDEPKRELPQQKKKAAIQQARPDKEANVQGSPMMEEGVTRKKMGTELLSMVAESAIEMYTNTSKASGASNTLDSKSSVATTSPPLGTARTKESTENPESHNIPALPSKYPFFDLSKLAPVRKPQKTPLRPKKVIEVVEKASNSVVVCFRGATDAARALGLERKVVNAACQAYDLNVEYNLGHYTLRYAGYDTPSSYEYGAHKEDFRQTFESHNQIKQRWNRVLVKEKAQRKRHEKAAAAKQEAAAAKDHPQQLRDQCMVCQQVSVEIVFEPCRHCVLCAACAERSCRRYCPLCRTPIVSRKQPDQMSLVRPRIYSAYSFM